MSSRVWTVGGRMLESRRLRVGYGGAYSVLTSRGAVWVYKHGYARRTRPVGVLLKGALHPHSRTVKRTPGHPGQPSHYPRFPKRRPWTLSHLRRPRLRWHLSRPRPRSTSLLARLWARSPSRRLSALRSRRCSPNQGSPGRASNTWPKTGTPAAAEVCGMAMAAGVRTLAAEGARRGELPGAGPRQHLPA